MNVDKISQDTKDAENLGGGAIIQRDRRGLENETGYMQELDTHKTFPRFERPSRMHACPSVGWNKLHDFCTIRRGITQPNMVLSWIVLCFSFE